MACFNRGGLCPVGGGDILSRFSVPGVSPEIWLAEGCLLKCSHIFSQPFGSRLDRSHFYFGFCFRLSISPLQFDLAWGCAAFSCEFVCILPDLWNSAITEDHSFVINRTWFS